VWGVRRVYRATLTVAPSILVAEQRQSRVEIRLSEIEAIVPWLVPLPHSGLTLEMRSGKRWHGGIEMQDPAALIDAIGGIGESPRLADAARHPCFVSSRARAGSVAASWHHLLLKFPVFALVPTIPLFRVHQIIAYGGAFGEYYLYGIRAYLTAFFLYWGTLTIYLLAFAAALRIPVEIVSIACSWANPRRAAGARQLLERAAAVVYYAGVPLAVALRFVPW
jgi:apolipoprotein N-acyltransferase